MSKDVTPEEIHYELPQDISPAEAKAGFRLEDIHPGIGIPENGVVLIFPSGHRILKCRTATDGGVVYVHQIPKIVNGQTVFGDGVIYRDFDLALSFARLHDELGD
jgi:hypothetical protein